MYNEIKEKMDDLKSWLVKLYKEKKNGWPAVEAHDEVGILTTCAAVRTFVEVEKINYSEIYPAIQYILDTQSQYGGWTLIRGNNVESTLSVAEAIQALFTVRTKYLHQSIIGDVESAIILALQWVFSFHNNDGGWSTIVSKGREIKRESSTYATAIMIIALCIFYRQKDDEFVVDQLDNIKKHIDEAFGFLSKCRNADGLWRDSLDSEYTDLSISAAVAYAYYLYYGEKASDVIEFIRTIGLNPQNLTLSLPVGQERIQLPDGDVQFYINGAYWTCRLFAERKESYIGFLPFIHYLISNVEDYYFLTDIANNKIQKQCTWVSVDILGLGRTLWSLPRTVYQDSIILASTFLSGLDYETFKKNHNYILFDSFTTSLDTEKLAIMMTKSTCCADDIRFCESFAQCWPLLKPSDDGSELIEKYENHIMEKMRSIESYEEYLGYSDKQIDYNGFSIIRHIKSYSYILKIVFSLSNMNNDTAIRHFYELLSYDYREFITYDVFYNLLKIISLFEFEYNDSEIATEQIKATRKAVQFYFSEEILNGPFDKLLSIPYWEFQLQEDEQESVEFDKINVSIRTGVSVLTDDEYFGRNKEILLACNKIKNGNSIAITGDFRIGKSSFLNKLLKKLCEDYNYLICDLDFTTSLSYGKSDDMVIARNFVLFLTERIKAILEDNNIQSFSKGRALSNVKKITKTINSISIGPISVSKEDDKGEANINLLEEVEKLIKTINDDCLKVENKYLVIAIDEFNNYSNARESSQVVNQICRTITQKADHMRLVVASQNIFDTKKQRGPVPLTTVLTTIMLTGYEKDDISSYIQSKDNRLITTDKSANLIKEYTGGSPFWLGLFLNEIIEQLNKSKKYTISESVVLECVERFLQISDIKSKMEWYYTEILEDNEIIRRIIFCLSRNEWISGSRLFSIIQRENNDISENDSHDYFDELNGLVLKGVVRDRNVEGKKEYSIIIGLFRRWIVDNYGGIE